MLKATRFMRLPFFVTGYQVTLDNMDDIAKWCQGVVIREENKPPFIRVPVNRPAHIKQTEAYEGTWVLVSKKYGKTSFKVYDEVWLGDHFVKVNTSPEDEVTAADLIPISSVPSLKTPFLPVKHG